MTDIREFNKTKKNEPGKMVDFDKAAAELKVRKESLTKENRPLFIEWVNKQP
uniref:Uncharacterized protein n=1 Tax=viral metagenome TaxID=1070528 RepID=A0A6M3KWC5_9ZZZZ